MCINRVDMDWLIIAWLGSYLAIVNFITVYIIQDYITVLPVVIFISELASDVAEAFVTYKGCVLDREDSFINYVGYLVSHD